MDPTNPNLGAPAAPSAAPINPATNAVPGATTPIPEAVSPTPGSASPIDGQAPGAAVVPPTPVSPIGDTQPVIAAPTQPDPAESERRARQAEAELQRIHLMLQQAQAETQRQQAEQQEQQRFQQDLQFHQAQASQMEPERAIQYMNQFWQNHLAQQRQREVLLQQQARAQMEQLSAHLTAPLYADHLAKEHNLPADLAQQLRALPGPMQDQVLPILVTAARAREQAAQAAKQQTLTEQAQAMQATGAYTVGSGTALAGAAPADRSKMSQRQRDMADWMALKSARSGY